MRNTIIVKGLWLVGALAVFGWLLWLTVADGDGRHPGASGTVTKTAVAERKISEAAERIGHNDQEPPEVAQTSEPLNETSDDQSDEEDHDEKLVSAFDDEVDRWMDAEKSKPPTMKDVEEFCQQFKALPSERKEECLHRALNLIPDENIMLLVGILLDKSVDKEQVESVYNDVLNRDESVKGPILQMIFKDKAHPCWADTAWILDVTGTMR